MRFPSKPKPEIRDESFLEQAPRGSMPEPSDQRSPPADAETGSRPAKRSRRRERRQTPARPVEKAALAHKTFRIPAALARRLEALVRVTTKTQTQIVVEATETRVAELEQEYRRRTGQSVPSFTIVRIE